MTIDKDDLGKLLDAVYDLKRAVTKVRAPVPVYERLAVPSWVFVVVVTAVLVNFILLVSVVELHRQVNDLKETIVIPDKKERK